MSHQRLPITGALLFPFAVACTIAIVLLSAYGTNGMLLRDDGAYLYSGQQLVHGVPPYVSIVDAKTPLFTFFLAAAIRIGRLFGTDDVQAVRVASLGLAGLSAGLLVLLALHCFASRAAGWLAALVLVASRGYAQLAASGPNPKVLGLFLQVAVLALAAGRRWFLCGVAGGLAFLTWQPLVILPVFTVVLAVAQSAPGQRVRAGIAAAAGVLLPVLAMVAYFAATRSLPDLIWSIITHPRLVEQSRLEAFDLARRLLRPLEVIRTNYATLGTLILLGLATMAVWAVARWRHGGARSMVQNDPWALLVLAFPLHLAFALLDFQGQADLYPLLPYAALGAGWLLTLGADGLRRESAWGACGRRAVLLALAAVLAGVAWHDYRAPADRGLEKQVRWATTIERRYLRQGDSNLLSIGRPEVLALLGRTNPNPYIAFYRGIPELIAVVEPGGFDGWLARQLDARPGVVVLGPISSDKAEHTVRAALVARGYTEATVGEWTVLARPH